VTTTIKGARTIANDQTLSGNLLFSSSVSVAAAGTTQGTATLLTSQYNIITSGTLNQGVILPPISSVGAQTVYVSTGSIAVNLKLYPGTGASLQPLQLELATNAALTMVPFYEGFYICVPVSSTGWSVSLSPPIANQTSGIAGFSAPVGATGFSAVNGTIVAGLSITNKTANFTFSNNQNGGVYTCSTDGVVLSTGINNATGSHFFFINTAAAGAAAIAVTNGTGITLVGTVGAVSFNGAGTLTNTKATALPGDYVEFVQDASTVKWYCLGSKGLWAFA